MLKTVNFTTPNYANNNKLAQNKNENQTAPAHAATQSLKAAPAPLGRGAYGAKINFGGLNTAVRVDFYKIGKSCDAIAHRLNTLLPEQVEKIRASVNTLMAETGKPSTARYNGSPEATLLLAENIRDLNPFPKIQTIGDIEATRFLNNGNPKEALNVLKTVQKRTTLLSSYGKRLCTALTGSDDPVNVRPDIKPLDLKNDLTPQS